MCLSDGSARLGCNAAAAGSFSHLRNRRGILMKCRKQTPMCVDQLESRSLLSGFHHGGGGLLSNPSPAVQADLTKIQTDQQKLQTDIKTLAPTLQSGFQAIVTAINN